MAPEQVNGQPATAATDVYALGTIFYELLTGRMPFRGDAINVMVRIATEDPDLPSALRPDLDPRLGAICLKAMGKKPEVRFAAMADLADALGDWLKTDVPRG